MADYLENAPPGGGVLQLAAPKLAIPLMKESDQLWRARLRWVEANPSVPIGPFTSVQRKFLAATFSGAQAVSAKSATTSFISVIRIPGGRTVKLAEWEDFSSVAIWRVLGLDGLNQRSNVTFPDRCILQSIKVDTEIPYPELACLWIELDVSRRLVADNGVELPPKLVRTYSFPCSAFDRLYPQYIAQAAAQLDEEGELKDG